MKAYKLILPILLFFPGLLIAQKTVYFNAEWLQTPKSEASYYSTIYPIKNGKFEVKDYLVSGILLSSTEYQPLADDIDWNRIYEQGFQEMAIEDGLCIEYYANGKKKKRFSYLKGKQSGEVREWSKDGNLLLKYLAEDNRANGLYLEYFKNGKTKLAVNFRNDTLNGPAAYYHVNGVMSQKGSFKAGKKVGQWTYWNDRRDVIGRESYRESFFIEGPDLKIHLPHGNWCLSNQFKEDEMMYFVFVRNGDIEKLTSGIAPVLTVSLEYLGDDTNLVDYSSFKRRRLSMDIKKIISQDQDLFSLSNSMGYLGTYRDENEKPYTGVVVHSIQKSIGVELRFDIRQEDYEDVKNEVVTILRSINK